MPNVVRRFTSVGALLWLTAVAPTTAQPSSGAIRCPACPDSGQRADTAAFDPSQVRVIAPIRKFFSDDRTFEEIVIARVLRASPLILDILDGRGETLDRNRRRVEQVEDEQAACRVERVEAVDAASRGTVAALRFNDLITGRVVMHHDDRDRDKPPDNVVVLTAIRRIVPPVRFLHDAPTAGCTDRSGVLVEFRSVANEAVTIYNDGAIHYRDPLMRQFNRERLSDAEVADLMQAFRAADFDTLRNDMAPPGWGTLPGVTLFGARYQDVWLGGNEARLEPLVRRLTAISARALSGTTLVLKARNRQRPAIEPWPFPNVPLAGFNERRQRGVDEHDRTQNISAESRALEQRLPDALLARVPEHLPAAPDPAADRLVYFTEAGRLYRLSKNSRCAGRPWCENTLYVLNVDEVQSVEDHLRNMASRTQVTTRYGGPSEPSTQGHSIDPDRINEYSLALNYPWPYLWPSGMGLQLTALPSDGAAIPIAEYERHKAAYLALLMTRDRGADLIENGTLFQHVRVCRLEPGVVDDCPVR